MGLQAGLFGRAGFQFFDFGLLGVATFLLVQDDRLLFFYSLNQERNESIVVQCFKIQRRRNFFPFAISLFRLTSRFYGLGQYD